MEEEIRKIVRDELSKYFCNIDNNDECDFEIINDLERQLEEKEVELYKRTEECKELRERNKTLVDTILKFKMCHSDEVNKKVDSYLF